MDYFLGGLCWRESGISLIVIIYCNFLISWDFLGTLVNYVVCMYIASFRQYTPIQTLIFYYNFILVLEQVFACLNSGKPLLPVSILLQFYLSQRKYLLDLLSETSMLACKSAKTPIFSESSSSYISRTNSNG